MPSTVAGQAALEDWIRDQAHATVAATSALLLQTPPGDKGSTASRATGSAAEDPFEAQQAKFQRQAQGLKEMKEALENQQDLAADAHTKAVEHGQRSVGAHEVPQHENQTWHATGQAGESWAPPSPPLKDTGSAWPPKVPIEDVLIEAAVRSAIRDDAKGWALPPSDDETDDQAAAQKAAQQEVVTQHEAAENATARAVHEGRRQVGAFDIPPAESEDWKQHEDVSHQLVIQDGLGHSFKAAPHDTADSLGVHGGQATGTEGYPGSEQEPQAGAWLPSPNGNSSMELLVHHGAHSEEAHIAKALHEAGAVRDELGSKRREEPADPLAGFGEAADPKVLQDSLDGLGDLVKKEDAKVKDAHAKAVLHGHTVAGSPEKPNKELEEWHQRGGDLTEDATKPLMRHDRKGHTYRGGLDDGSFGAQGGQATATTNNTEDTSGGGDLVKEARLDDATAAEAVLVQLLTHARNASEGLAEAAQAMEGFNTSAWASFDEEMKAEQAAAAEKLPLIANHSAHYERTEAIPAAQHEDWVRQQDTSPAVWRTIQGSMTRPAQAPAPAPPVEESSWVDGGPPRPQAGAPDNIVQDTA